MSRELPQWIDAELIDEIGRDISESGFFVADGSSITNPEQLVSYATEIAERLRVNGVKFTALIGTWAAGGIRGDYALYDSPRCNTEGVMEKLRGE